jgi:hypothetical protein
MRRDVAPFEDTKHVTRRPVDDHRKCIPWLPRQHSEEKMAMKLLGQLVETRYRSMSGRRVERLSEIVEKISVPAARKWECTDLAHKAAEARTRRVINRENDRVLS